MATTCLALCPGAPPRLACSLCSCSPATRCCARRNRLSSHSGEPRRLAVPGSAEVAGSAAGTRGRLLNLAPPALGCRLCDASQGPDCRGEARLPPCPAAEPSVEAAAGGVAQDGTGAGTAGAAADGGGGGGSSTGAIIGGVVGGVVAAAGVLTLLLVRRRRHRRQRERERQLPFHASEVRSQQKLHFPAAAAPPCLACACALVRLLLWHFAVQRQFIAPLPACKPPDPVPQDKSSYSLPAARGAPSGRPDPLPLLPSPFAALTAELEPSPTHSVSDPALGSPAGQRRPAQRTVSAGSFFSRLMGRDGEAAVAAAGAALLAPKSCLGWAGLGSPQPGRAGSCAGELGLIERHTSLWLQTPTGPWIERLTGTWPVSVCAAAWIGLRENVAGPDRRWLAKPGCLLAAAQHSLLEASRW